MFFVCVSALAKNNEGKNALYHAEQNEALKVTDYIKGKNASA